MEALLQLGGIVDSISLLETSLAESSSAQRLECLAEFSVLAVEVKYSDGGADKEIPMSSTCRGLADKNTSREAEQLAS